MNVARVKDKNKPNARSDTQTQMHIQQTIHSGRRDTVCKSGENIHMVGWRPLLSALLCSALLLNIRAKI